MSIRMKCKLLALLSLVFVQSAWADFSGATALIHPWYLDANDPYIVEIIGDWPTDCHPGEQKPIISEYTGDTALIEFETIVDRTTCNDVVTPYRVLVDMSDVVGSLEGEFPHTEITIRFDGAELEAHMPHRCIALCSPVPLPRDVKPEAGSYARNGLEKQGLLLSRQNQRMGVFPLIYDDSGSSEWLLGPGGIVENVFFAELFESTGGQCLGCLPPDEPPQMNAVGRISMLMDSEGVIQVKVNDGLFEEYRPLEFGYGEFSVYDINNSASHKIPNLTGRWALADDNSDVRSETSPLPSTVLPLVFDIEQGINWNPPPPVVGPLPTNHIEYSILSMEEEVVAEMVCVYAIEGDDENEMVCDLKSPTFNDFEHWFSVSALSIERVFMKNMAEIDGVARGAGTAVRID